ASEAAPPFLRLLRRVYLFASFWPVEQHPHHEIVVERLEAMHHPGGHEKKVAGAEALAGVAVDEPARAFNDDVHLVARVWCLRIVAAWGIQFDVEAAMLKDRNEALAVRSGQQIQPFCHRNAAAWVF